MALENRQAFVTALERTHGRRLRRYLAARLRNARADVPDLVQEIYLRLLRVDDHEAIRNSQAYLFTVASHVLHQHALRQAAAGGCVDLADVMPQAGGADNDETHEPVHPETDPANELELEQRFERLGHGLKAHSPRAYATLLLHRCDGWSLQEVADQFDVSYSMARKYLAIALHYLQVHLEESE